MIITIAAQKGGVSKTTTASAIAQALTYTGKKSLIVDTDAQGGASLIYGASVENEGGVYALIKGTKEAKDLIQHTDAGDIIPASPLLDRLNIELSNKPGRDNFLKNGLFSVAKNYENIIIDTAPGLGTCLIQALTACDLVIIPLLCDTQALQGLYQIKQTIDEVKAYCNPSLKVGAVILTQYQPRANLTRQYEDLIQKQCKELGLYCAKTRIRKGIAIQEAQAMRENLFNYNNKSNPAVDYMELCKELKLIRKGR